MLTAKCLATALVICDMPGPIICRTKDDTPQHKEEITTCLIASIDNWTPSGPETDNE